MRPRRLWWEGTSRLGGPRRRSMGSGASEAGGAGAVDTGGRVAAGVVGGGELPRPHSRRAQIAIHPTNSCLSKMVVRSRLDKLEEHVLKEAFMEKEEHVLKEARW